MALLTIALSGIVEKLVALAGEITQTISLNGEVSSGTALVYSLDFSVAQNSMYLAVI